MVNFEFLNPTKIIFGKGTIAQLGDEIKAHGGTKVLVHLGGGSVKKNGVYDQVINSLNAAGVSFVEQWGVRPNPRVKLIREGIEICRKENVDFILAVGGGSVIDSAKGVAVGVPYDGDVWDFYIGKAEPKTKLPVATVLTIPAAGSESSWSSVVTNDEGAFKRPLDDAVLFPAFSILDPEATYTLPPYQTACGVADMMAHVMERYFTNIQHVELTDRLCEATLKTIMNNVKTALSEPENYDARAEIMWSGTVAHNNILHMGRIGDWASHNIEHELSAVNDVAHGEGLAVIFPAWMKYVYKHDIQRFVQFASRVFNIENNFHEPERTALKGIDALETFFRSIGLSTKLSEIGIGEDKFDMIAVKVLKSDGKTAGNFVKLTAGDIKKILEIAK
ncbi:MAG: iron-containing alcohol dehydrogenase [Clostridiales bacterium]|jgi:alcohol dehydrogenase YqhD (iron-dependent ADH family)|nr:iron-containing alcohol dehydrogenase [Clostridiales bacterium]